MSTDAGGSPMAGPPPPGYQPPGYPPPGYQGGPPPAYQGYPQPPGYPPPGYPGSAAWLRPPPAARHPVTALRVVIRRPVIPRRVRAIRLPARIRPAAGSPGH